MSMEVMSITVDSEMKRQFTESVQRFYSDKTLEEGIIDLMRIYVERTNGVPHQTELRKTIREHVLTGDQGGGPRSVEIEKMLLNKTDEEIEANRL